MTQYLFKYKIKEKISGKNEYESDDYVEIIKYEIFDEKNKLIERYFNIKNEYEINLFEIREYNLTAQDDEYYNLLRENKIINEKIEKLIKENIDYNELISRISSRRTKLDSKIIQNYHDNEVSELQKFITKNDNSINMLQKLKNNFTKSENLPIIFCDHANECPVVCPCNINCLCKNYTCKNKV